MDFTHVWKLLREQAHNFPGFEVALVQQEGQTTFALVGEHRAKDLPQLAAFIRIRRRWLPARAWFREWHFSASIVGPQHIQNRTVQATAQVAQRSAQAGKMQLLVMDGCHPETR